MKWVKRAWAELREGGLWLVALLGLLIGAGGVWALQRRKAALARANARLLVSEAHSRIAALRAERKAVEERFPEQEAALQEVKTKLAQNKGLIAQAYVTEGLSAKEVVDEFTRLGY